MLDCLALEGIPRQLIPASITALKSLNLPAFFTRANSRLVLFLIRT